MRMTEVAAPPGGGLGAGGVNVTATCDGTPVALSVTFWLNIPTEVTVTIAVLDSVTLMLKALGETEI
jgi:hypothetical protein